MKNYDSTKRKASKRAKKLRELLNYHSNLYHHLDKPEISDSGWDLLKNELSEIERKFPELKTPDSPNERIGGKPLDKFKKVRHVKPMLSLHDVSNKEDFVSWFLRVEKHLTQKITPSFYCELKMDGLAVELAYKNGIFILGSTRGDGIVGEDITQNLKMIKGIPLTLSIKRKNKYINKIPDSIVVRGEVYLTKKEFNKVNVELEKRDLPKYANPRNLAAGSLRQLDSRVTAKRMLDFFAYDIADGVQVEKHSNRHEVLDAIGFKINTNDKVVNTLDGVVSFMDYWETNRNNLPYETDGIVVTIDDNKTFLDAGFIGKGPRGAIAYKFQSMEAITKVLDIKIQVGRTGVLTPVSVLAPVLLSGVTISHATLHNYDEIKRLDLKIGDTVIVKRAGDVIPKITKVIKELRSGKEKEFKMPKKCPADGSPLTKDGVLVKCSDKNCGARLRESIFHFISRGGFNIEGLGRKIIDKFLDKQIISDAADLFFINKDDIKALKGFGEKSAENIVNEIRNNKKILLPKFIYSLGIINVGEETSISLANLFDKDKIEITPSHFLKYFKKLTSEDLESVPDIGPKVADGIIAFFSDKKILHFISKLDDAKIIIEIKKEKGEKLQGATFSLTGTLTKLSRDDAKVKIRSIGGKVSESVGKNTNFLIAGYDPGTKLDKAKKFGVKILNEKEFLKMIQ